MDVGDFNYATWNCFPILITFPFHRPLFLETGDWRLELPSSLSVVCASPLNLAASKRQYHPGYLSLRIKDSTTTDHKVARCRLLLPARSSFEPFKCKLHLTENAPTTTSPPTRATPHPPSQPLPTLHLTPAYWSTESLTSLRSNPLDSASPFIHPIPLPQPPMLLRFLFI